MFKRLMAIGLIGLLLSSCSTLDTQLFGDKPVELETLKKGRACSHNLFGGFKVPYIKETAIKLKGTQSLKYALTNGNISEVRIIDRYKKNYLFYTKLCTTVYGQ